MTDTPHDNLRKTLFSVRMSARYHRARQGFFDAMSTLFRLAALLSAMSVFTSIIASAPAWVAAYSAVLVALFQALDLVVDPSKRARLHDSLGNEFVSLEAAIVSRFGDQRDVVERDTAYFQQERLRIETREPPVLTWLALRSRNEQIVAQNSPDHAEIVYIPRLQRLLIHLGDVFTYGNGKAKVV